MSGNDDDKTVFGGRLPNPSQSDSPFSSPGSVPRPVPRPDDRTVIGGGVPDPRSGGRVAPSSDPRSFGQQAGDTWLGGPVRPSPPAGPGMGASQKDSFFPDVPPRQTEPQGQRVTPRISLEQALRTAGLGQGASSNPLIAAAANLLILFGRLRTGLVEMDAGPLMQHVTREIDLFERNALQAGVDPYQAQVAKYALCGTADDIVQNLPGADRGIWIQYSMVARFFNKRDSGVGFFQEAEKAMQAPAQWFRLLELMLVCLSLGFEGQYRTMPNGAVELGRIRSAIYETLRRIQPRPDDDISLRWQPVSLGRRRRFGGLSVGLVAAIAGVLVLAFFATLSTLIARDGAMVEANLLALHPRSIPLSIERSGLLELYEPEQTQLDRVREALAPEISDGQIVVGTKGDFIYVRVGNSTLFASGSADLDPDFEPLATRIADVLKAESGPIKVVGFTDADQPSGRGRFKTNYDLSVARAASVSELLTTLIGSPSRITVEGKGAEDPIADNTTEEGKALNRRVEIMLAREGTY